MALRYGLPRPEVFAGVAVLSGSLRRLEDLVPVLPDRRTMPLFVAHGRADQVVPMRVGQQLMTFLGEQGYRPTSKFYPMGHQISPGLMKDLRGWMEQLLAAG
jgi:phospholipase/carboxylesterase